MNWAGKRVLVTGAGGFIGSHLTERLVREGSKVTAFVRYTSQGRRGLLELLDPEVLAEIRVVFGDVRDADAIHRQVMEQDAVFHLAALVSIPYSYHHPNEFAQANIGGSLNVFNAAREADIERLVHTSTSETYGTALTDDPISEEHPLQAQSPYSASKIGADALAHAYWCSFGIPIVTIRPFNTYGPRQSGRAVIPTIIGQALQLDRVTLGALSPTRDFTFVSDTVEAFLSIGSREEAVGQVVNCGSGKEVSIGRLAERIIQRLNRDVQIETTGDRTRPEASEVFRLISDSSHAYELAGWHPLVTLDEGLDRTVEFLRKNPGWTALNDYEF